MSGSLQNRAASKTRAAASANLGQSETCGHCLARHPAAGGALSCSEVMDIHSDGKRVFLPARRRLTSRMAGDSALINLTAGAVKIFPSPNAARSGNSGAAGVGVIFAPDIISPSDGAITALSDCEMCCFSSSGLRRLFARHPRLQERFLRHSLESLHRAREQATLLNRPRAMERVAGLFWSCVRAAETRGAGVEDIAMPMRGAEMAALLGLSKETVSRCVSALRTKGLLRPLGRSRFGVPKPEALREICGG